jgi:hypothetical protein
LEKARRWLWQVVTHTFPIAQIALFAVLVITAFELSAGPNGKTG